MTRLFSFLTFLILGASAFGAEYRTWTLTATNGAFTGDRIYVGGTIRTGGTVRTSSAWVTNANKNATVTNIISQLGGFRIANVLVSQTDSNVIKFAGSDLVVTSTAFATLSVVTQSLGSPVWEIQGPASAFPGTRQNSNGTEIVNYINLTTNPISSTATGMVRFVGLTNVQTVANKEITNSIVRNGTNDGTKLTNIPSAYISELYVVTINADGSTSVLSGVISGGKIQFASVTNAPWVSATNANLGTARIDTLTVWNGLTVTNFNSPGLGQYSQIVGDGAVANGFTSVSVGYDMKSYGIANYGIGVGGRIHGDEVIGMGNSFLVGTGANLVVTFGTENIISNSYVVAAPGGNVAMHDNVVLLGYGVSSTKSNDVRLGKADWTTTVPGILRVESGITNHVTTGTNKFDARLDFASRSVSSLVNGANSGIVLGSNVFVKLSGGSTVCALSGFQAAQDGTFHILQISGGITNVIVNEANSTDYATDGTAANRIVTGTGTNFYSTNNPLVLPVIYDATAARWKVISFMR